MNIVRSLRGIVIVLVASAFLAPLSSCRGANELEVIATAYNSHPSQTQGDPRVTAWGDPLRPGIKAVAVSRDLISLGLTRGTEVEIEGLPGRYTVLDKMARRWEKRIDIYMGKDVRAAREWGRRRVTIRWRK